MLLLYFCLIFTVHDVRVILLVKQLPMLFDVLDMYCIWVIVQKASTALHCSEKHNISWNHFCTSILLSMHLQKNIWGWQWQLYEEIWYLGFAQLCNEWHIEIVVLSMQGTDYRQFTVQLQLKTLLPCILRLPLKLR